MGMNNYVSFDKMGMIKQRYPAVKPDEQEQQEKRQNICCSISSNVHLSF